MVSKEQATHTQSSRKRSRYCFGLTSKNLLQFLSSLMLPLMLGVFTVVVTFQQQKVANQQRLEDQQLARQQRLEDKNESRLQRQQDWNIAQDARNALTEANIEQYRNEILLDYIKEVGEFLKDNNGSLKPGSLEAVLLRAKTLNVIQQLDSARKPHVIRFLYETKQLTNTDGSFALDLSTVELTGIEFDKLKEILEKGHLSLAGVFLRNCTFFEDTIQNVNFSCAYFNDVNFSSARLGNVNFSFAKLYDVNFLSSTRLDDVNFTFATLHDINFSYAWVQSVDFSSAHLQDVNFSLARLYEVNFSSARLQNINFSSATLFNVNFSSTWLAGVIFSSTQFGGETTSFHRADLPDAIFQECSYEAADFTHANLKRSSLLGEPLSNADFSFANLQETDFTNSTITDSQLHSALSIRNAILPNGTVAQGQNLIKNGHVDCNSSVSTHWNIQHGNISVAQYLRNNSKNCRFSLESVTTGAMMSQRVDLTRVWDSSLWPESGVDLLAEMSSGVSIELSGISDDGTVLEKNSISSDVNHVIMYLKEDMRDLVVEVQFQTYNNESVWCDDIELFMDYDRYLHY